MAQAADHRLSLRLLADVSYVLWCDRLIADAEAGQVVAAILKASGRFTNLDGSEIEVPNPAQVRRDFDVSLHRALNYERMREAVLRAVNSA